MCRLKWLIPLFVYKCLFIESPFLGRTFTVTLLTEFQEKQFNSDFNIKTVHLNDVTIRTKVSVLGLVQTKHYSRTWCDTSSNQNGVKVFTSLNSIKTCKQTLAVNIKRFDISIGSNLHLKGFFLSLLFVHWWRVNNNPFL